MIDDGFFSAGATTGATKMVDIDFTLCFPATEYFVSVNLLVEFSAQG